MRYALAVLLFCAGIFCLAQSNAQVPMTGAGLGAPASGGGFTPCAGTALKMLSANQNDLTTWGVANSTQVANAATAPDSTTTASSMTATGNNATSGVDKTPTASGGGLTGGVTYSITGFIQPVVSPNWVYIGSTDFATYRISSYFNLGTGAVGSSDTVAGTLTCAKISPSTGAWFEYSIGLQPTSNASGAEIIIQYAAGDGNRTSTTNQEFYSWGVGQ